MENLVGIVGQILTLWITISPMILTGYEENISKIVLNLTDF